ncbi:MAG TPA: bifunctional UDP-N-acetylglucosamine diphosphorylase/glucosamine-1-phosphate N-acetyltransferase GlmU [Fimbriimonadaceae bacterium]|nr:bifunctional UDP-N-acetylglucosamine diphosphorylase/glucosamine-1-phosphate N-acetyltransferase GlmU [Fimbriimonadaceae bacterium]HRJ97242.1 bifunctional UDP-N-acetylglucosamine diphosphorylase/glucosamine-1-phosphate N-acetyltransferase GlmU [Fimbriimonadaceae bacterium]
MKSVSILAGIVLAAGKGTRMKSDQPKALFPIIGLPMAEWVGRAMREAGIEKPIVVIGHQADLVRERLSESYGYALQAEQHGTGHAVSMAREALDGYDGPVLIAPGDAPLLDGEALQALAQHHAKTGAVATLATTTPADPTGYGRIVRCSTGGVSRIVEERDASDDERRIGEVNAGIYCFDCQALFEALPRLGSANAQGEFYLTDVIALLADAGRVETLSLPEEAVAGVNDRWQLAEAEATLRRRILRRHALAGVTIVDPGTTIVGPDVRIGGDVEILPNTIVLGETVIESGAIIGPGSVVKDSQIGTNCEVLMSHLARAVMKEGSKCGPFANLRPGAVIGEGAKVGNFVEIKKSSLGAGASVAHLTYLGDATVGEGTNVGAGTITCNYDGFDKSPTKIGANAFIGSNSTLVAPVTIGDGAIIGAGSVITTDVPGDALGLGRSRQENKEQWAPQWRERKRRPR